VAVALIAGLVFAVARPHGSASAARYGGLPSWLPKSTIPVGRIVTASAARPQLAIEGDTVEVVMPQGRVMATAVGPAVTSQGQSPPPPVTGCTFTVTLTQASGVVSISSGAFTIVDEQSQLHHPRVTTQDGAPPPAQVHPGQTVTLNVSEVLPTGNGQLRWAPQGGAPIVSWDFDVEVD